MALFSRRVLAVREAAVFVAPAAGRRQLCLLQLEVHRLGSDQAGVNVLVVPVPRSAVREATLFDAKLYSTAFNDLRSSFGEATAGAAATATDLYIGSKKSRPALYCKSVADLEEARMDGVLLRIPRRVTRIAETKYGGGDFGFFVIVFSQRSAVVRLHLSYSHPLMRGRLHVPRAVFAPKGIPFGERNDICNDEDPEWSRQHVHVYAANASRSFLPLCVSLEDVQQQPGPHASGLVWSALPAQLQGGPHVMLLSGSLPMAQNDVWARLATAFVGLQRAHSAAASGNVRAALDTFDGLAEHKPCSTVLAHFAAFCAGQGDGEGATQLWRQAATCNRHNPLVATLFGECLARGPARAGRAFRRAIAQDPYTSRALAGLALTLSEGSFDAVPEAEALLRRALLLDPTHEQAATRLASLAQPPSGMGLVRADAVLAAKRQEERETVQHLGGYLSFLNSERKALFGDCEV